MKRLPPTISLLLASNCSLAACGGAPSSTGFDIVNAGGGALRAASGDALKLDVVETLSDGSSRGLPANAVISWSSPPSWTAAFIDNPERPDRNADLRGVVFILAHGPDVVAVTATIEGAGLVGRATASIAVSPPPSSDAARGATLYGTGGAQCSACHGATGHGSERDANGKTYTMLGRHYPYPAPGLNAESGNLASDSAWDASLFAMSARADVDNHGTSLRAPMPDWLGAVNPATGRPLTTAELADIYAFLRTQSQ